MSKEVGDEFFLRQGSFQDKKATVLQIETKGVYRFNVCINEWENRFDEFFMQAMTMPSEVDPKNWTA